MRRPDFSRLKRSSAVALALLVATAVLSACGDNNGATDSSGDGADQPPAPLVVGTREPVTVMVRAVERQGDKTFVELRTINGSNDEIELTSENSVARLRSASGADLTSTNKPLSVPALSTDDSRLEFRGQLGDGPLQLEFNSRGNFRGSPRLQITDIPMPAKGRLVFNTEIAPASAPLQDTVAYHPNGTSIVLRNIATDSAGVEISYLLVNGASEQVELAGESDPIILTDSTGRTLAATASSASGEVTVPAYSRTTGVLRFPGQLSPDARSATLFINQESGSADNTFTGAPKFTVTDIPIPKPSEGPAATQPALPPLPKPQTVDLQATHPNGTTARITGATFHDDHIAVTASATNNSDGSISLAEYNAIVRDDQGTIYRMAPPVANPDLDIPQGETAEYNLVFLGRINPRANSFTVAFNDRLNSDSKFTNDPTIRLSSVPVQR